MPDVATNRVEIKASEKVKGLSNIAKLLLAYMEITGVTCAKTISDKLGIPVRTIQRLKLDCATAMDGASSAVEATPLAPDMALISTESDATSATDGVFDAPLAPDMAFSPSRVLDNNIITNLASSSVSEVKKDICAILPLPTNPRAKGTNSRQAGSSDELGVKFEQFWSIFPAGRKRAKGKCRSIFVLIARGGHHSYKATADQMIDSARRYAATKPDAKYVPMPLTWLNQGRWEDDAAQAEAPAVTAKVEYHYPTWYLEEVASMNGGRA